MTEFSAGWARYFATIVSPTWTEHRGCVLRTENFGPDNFEKWWQATDGDRAKIEYGINHVHLWDYVPDADDNEDDLRELRALCETVARSWTSGLRAAFPDREFQVTIENSYGPTVYAISKSPT